MWQAARSLAASDVLGHQVLLQPGLVAALANLIRPQHLAALADWHARSAPAAAPDVGLGAAGPAAGGGAIPVLVANVLHEGIIHAQPAALRDVYQVQTELAHAWTH